MIAEVRCDVHAGRTGYYFSVEHAGCTDIRVFPKARIGEESLSQWRAAAKVKSPVLHKELQQALMRHIWKLKSE
jgi:hypothetical protein